MKIFEANRLEDRYQYSISVGLVLSVSIICFLLSSLIGYKVAALILLMVVSLIAMLFSIAPVILAAILSALIWNFFFIPPTFTFHVDNAEDLLMFFLYFFIALVNAVLTYKIRQAEKKSRDKEEKEKELRLYNTLLSSLSHELRTPIAAILGSVDTLREHKEKLTQETEASLLDEIGIAGLRLNRQVQNLLNMSRVETGMLQPRPDWTDMEELIHGIKQKLSPKDDRIFLTKENNLPLFKLDAGFTEQIIHNILYNATLYTPPYSPIDIHIKQQDDECIVIISDNGAGFPADEIDFVFNKFYRLRNTKTGGSGLGLSIAKGFVEAQHGRIKLENKESGGARFTISIPAETTYINSLKHA